MPSIDTQKKKKKKQAALPKQPGTCFQRLHLINLKSKQASQQKAKLEVRTQRHPTEQNTSAVPATGTHVISLFYNENQKILDLCCV